MRALLPEKGVSKRFRVEVRRDGKDVVVQVCADDVSALRAALNAYLRYLLLLRNVLKTVGTK